MKWLLLAATIANVYSLDSPIDLLHRASVNFSAKLYKELISRDAKPVLACPLTIEMALAVLHSGADGQTAKEIASGLSLPNDNTAIQNMFGDLFNTFDKIDKDYDTLILANKLYLQEDYIIADLFKDTAAEVFRSMVEDIDFKDESEAMVAMNNWAKQKTNSTISEIVTENDITDDMKAIFLNTVYFQSLWISPFYEKHTKKATFFLDQTKTKQVNMMKGNADFDYYESAYLNAKFLKMDYQAHDISMVIALPNDKSGIWFLEDRINEVFTVKKYQRKKVNVLIPKFTATSTIRLKSILEDLGVKDAFATTADFSGITEQEDLFINEAIQKIYIEVNEKGTIASSASAMFISESGFEDLEPPKEFKADHPFIYCIQSSSAILFIGKYNGL